MATQLITLNELNNNPIFQPPKEWIDEINQQEEIIKNDFFNNYPEIHNLINNKKKELEDAEYQIYNKYIDEIKPSIEAFCRSNRIRDFIINQWNLSKISTMKLLERTAFGFKSFCMNKHYHTIQNPDPNDPFDYNHEISLHLADVCDYMNRDELVKEIGYNIQKIISNRLYDYRFYPTDQSKYNIINNVVPLLKKEFKIKSDGSWNTAYWIEKQLIDVERDLIIYLNVLNKYLKVIGFKGLIKKHMDLHCFSLCIKKFSIQNDTTSYIEQFNNCFLNLPYYVMANRLRFLSSN